MSLTVLYSSKNYVLCKEDHNRINALGKVQQYNNDRISTKHKKRFKIVELFNYGCKGCYSLQKYMFFWKKSSLLLNKSVVNYYIPINISNEPSSAWSILSKFYFASVRLNVSKLFNNEIFFNINENSNNLAYEKNLKSLEQFFINIKIKKTLINKTVDSNCILQDMKNSNILKHDFKVRETPSILICTDQGVSKLNLSNNLDILNIIQSIESKIKRIY